MLSFSVGALGFLAVAAYDLAQIHRRNRAAIALSIIGYLCIAASIVFLMVSDVPANSPFSLFVVKAVFALGFFVLLIYSVVLEIPLALRHVKPAPAGARCVVAAGTYALVRHPGFLWFTLMWVAIILIYLNPVVTVVGLGMVTLDFLLVVFEDIVFFPRIFSNYAWYKKHTPFLLPRLKVR